MSSTAVPVFRREGLVDPQGDRLYHRLSTVRATSIVVPIVETEQPSLYLGRLTPFYEANSRVFPRFLWREVYEDLSLIGKRTAKLPERGLRLTVTVMQGASGRILYSVTIDFAAPTNQLVPVLEDSYYEDWSVKTNRDRLIPLRELVDASVRRVEGAGDWVTTAEVNQLFFLSPRLCSDVIKRTRAGDLRYNPEFLLSLIYRVGGKLRRGFTSVQFPPELNRGMRVLGAVGTFMSVFSGHQDYAENAYYLSAIQVLAATSELRAVERSIATSYDLVRDHLDVLSRSRRRAILQQLSGELAGHEMSLSEYVESASDVGLWIPAQRVEDYHRVLVTSVRLLDRAALLSTSITRLTSIVSARAQVLVVEEQQVQEHRRRSWGLVVGLLTSVAVPLSLILAFFGISASDIDPSASIFDMRRYGEVYLFAGVALFASLAIVGAFYLLAHPDRSLRRRSRRTVPK